VQSLFSSVGKPDVNKAEQAIQQILKGVQKDPSNGYWYYLMAAAHARQGQTAQAIKDLKKGNQQTGCYLYVTGETALDVYKFCAPPATVLSQIIRDLAVQAPQLGTEAGVEALQAAWTMGGKITGQEPQLLINVLIGCSLRSRAIRELAKLYERVGLSQQAQATRELEARNKQWDTSVRAIVEGHTVWINTECRKWGVNLDQLNNPPPELKEKVEKLGDHLLQKEGEAVEQALRTMPP
jgi:tetratricopeptide (TPR) repeat protein